MSFEPRGLSIHSNEILPPQPPPQPPPQHDLHKTPELSPQQPSEICAKMQALQQHPTAGSQCRGEYPGLERWALAKELGNGTFGKVYHAKDSRGQVPDVAIKIISKSKDLNQEADILQEVQVMRELDHENIAKFLGFSESEEHYFVFLELCPGGDLFHQIIRLSYFSEELSRHVIIQVARAIEYLHEERGIIHGDIKPENILLYPIPFSPTKIPVLMQTDYNNKVDEGEFLVGVGSGGIGRIKIADFGFSRSFWEGQTATTCCTPTYAAPEIVKGAPSSKSVDVWALGCVLYVLLCGFPPFYGTDKHSLKSVIARGQYEFLSPWWDDISASAQDLIAHLLRIDPSERFTMAEFFDHPWICNRERGSQG
ncbi:Pkinase-domain-containing protein [Thozetella sp. PMI_491]|nr:Pkinase-domain-containing protein [Thozetella sp. PMI_491]